MGKALSIKHEATYELVAELARQKGISMTQAVNAAVSVSLEKLKASRATEAKAWLSRLQEAGPLPEDAWVEPPEPPMPAFDPIWSR